LECKNTWQFYSVNTTFFVFSRKDHFELFCISGYIEYAWWLLQKIKGLNSVVIQDYHIVVYLSLLFKKKIRGPVI